MRGVRSADRHGGRFVAAPAEHGARIGLDGLALVLGGLAASSVAGREPALTAGGSSGRPAPGARVVASLRVTLRQAVSVAAAQDFARELRLLPRSAGDRERGRAGLRAGAQLP